MNWKLELPAIVLVTVLTMPTIWFFVGIEIYGQVARASPLCQENEDSDHYGNLPNSYDVSLYGEDIDWFNTTSYTIDEWENVTIPSLDEEIELSGWWAETNPGGPTVLLIHGVRSCKENHVIILQGSMLHNAGFNVLAIDLRDHGNSTIEDMRVSAGQKEWRDVAGAWEWLQDEQGVPKEQIGILGNSMGAATVAITFSLVKDVQAVWLDSSYHDMTRIINSELQRLSLPTMFTSAGIYAGIFSAGEDITAHEPYEAVRNVGERSIFIVHNEADERVAFVHGEDMCNDARNSVSTGYVDCWFVNTTIDDDVFDEPIGHIVPLLTMSDQYEQKLVSFFTQSLDHQLSVDYSPINQVFSPQ